MIEIRRGRLTHVIRRSHVIQTVLALVNSFKPSSESSRPNPERLIPPKGSSGVETTMALTKTAPGLDLLDTAPLLFLVVRPDARAEPERGGVRHLNGRVEIGHTLDDGHRAEDLLLRHRHVGGDAREHGRA